MTQEELERRTREIVKENAFIGYNHMELKEVEPDRAVFSLEIRPESTNGYGVVHGGALYGLADNAAGCAVHTDGRSYVTQNGSLNFLSNQSQGTVLAEGRVRRRGHRTVLAAVDITGEDGRLLATGEFLYFCIGEK